MSALDAVFTAIAGGRQWLADVGWLSGVEQAEIESGMRSPTDPQRLIDPDLVVSLVGLAEWAKKLFECDCVSCEFSSRACPKCGRRGVLSKETFEDILGKANGYEQAVERACELERALNRERPKP